MKSLLIASVLASVLAGSAFARPVDVNKPLLGIDGKTPMLRCEDATKPECKEAETLREIIVIALLRPDRQGDQPSSPDEKQKLFAAAVKTQTQPIPDYSSEDITLVKKRVGELFPPLVVGRVNEYLDPPASEEPKK